MTQAFLQPANAPATGRDHGTGIDPALLAREREHFDRHYADEAAQGVGELSDYDRVRYTDPPANTIFPREYYYHLLSPLRGKRVMEIAAGNGIDAALITHNGAQLSAYDLSPESIAMVRRRCEINGTADRLSTQVTGSFDDAFAGETFDHIVGYAALHHLPDMDSLAQRVYDRLKPGGTAVFAEPVLNSKLLGFARRCVPLAIDDMTDDERPLTDTDMRRFAEPFDAMRCRYFQLTSRVWRLWPNRWPLAVALHKLDHALLKLPMAHKFATVCVAEYRRKN
ncbi:MAG: class I SAM-dependent methyltransferase [Phycisphaeraceae bacterium]